MDLELIKGDITKQPYLDVVVNAANSQLAPGGGVAGAIHRAAGPKLHKECRQHVPIEPGECVLTNAYELPNGYVLHCLGPRYKVDTPSDKLLADCHKNAIKLADEHGIESVGFPAVSTGAFGYPTKKAAPIALQATRDALANTTSIKRVVFVLFSQEDLVIFENALTSLKNGN